MVSHISIPDFLIPFYIIGPRTTRPCENPNCPATPEEEVAAILRAISAWATDITLKHMKAQLDSEILMRDLELEQLEKWIEVDRLITAVMTD
ncbi:hypothetical protein Vi05172_g12362 [Venturia inaequalis]|nr:hypothetical protein Vi05172_g12362 [Venturia inaequalis]